MDKKKLIDGLKVVGIDLFVWIWAFAFFALSRHIDNFILQCLVMSVGMFPGNWYILEYLRKKYEV
jgi:hypothetical protein